MKRILWVITLLILPSFVYAQKSAFSEFKVNLLLTVDEDISSKISSFIKREFSSLSDVEIDETDPTWEIRIIAHKTRDTWKRVMGVVFSVVVVRVFDDDSLLEHVIPDRRLLVRIKILNLKKIFKNQSVYMGTEDDLKRICEDIVADFDSNQLEPIRKLRSRIMTNEEKINPK